MFFYLLGMYHAAPKFFVSSMFNLCGLLNYFMCSVLAYVKPFIDRDLIDFITFCLWNNKYPLIQ